ncbi:hypothetical protein [Blautia sp.]
MSRCGAFMNDRFGMEATEEFANGRVLERFCFVYVVLKVYERKNT